jgi:hypothetical protein
VKVKVRVKYSNYGVGRTDVKAIGDEEDVVVEPAKPAPSPTPETKKP